MTNRITETSTRMYARIAGFGLLLMFILAISVIFLLSRMLLFQEMLQQLLPTLMKMSCYSAAVLSVLSSFLFLMYW